MAANRALCVAEKPSVARELAAILSGSQANPIRTNSQYNPKFEFAYDMDGRMMQLVVTSVTGHLKENDFPQAYKKWHSCDPIKLLDTSVPLEWRVPQDKQGLERNLREEARRCGQLICFLDCDREGENISFEVIDVCREGNPRIVLRRAHFSALIPRDIHRAMRQLTDPDKRLSDAVAARSEIDLRLGAAFTRFQTLSLAKRFEETTDKTLSWGPCQFATLGFIVDRAWKIEQFEAEDFWGIGCGVARAGKVAQFEWARGRLFDRALCVALYEGCVEAGEARVVRVAERERRRWRPLPLATVALQTLASRKLRVGAEETMQIAEELYTKGFISYPRTETEKFKQGTDLADLIRKQTDSPQWGEFARGLVDRGNFLWPRNGPNDDQAHPPIHPTRFTDALSGKPKQVYELVVRHFLACCAKDALGAETAVEVEIDEESFTCKGLMIKELNWLEVYPYERWSDKDIPVFAEGEVLQPTELRMTAGRTQAPGLLTEGDLISMMDRHGIGTDATIAQHISTVQTREYATKSQAQQFAPTQLGRSLVTSYEAIGLELARPHFRARMEADMSDIASGAKDRRGVIEQWMAVMRPILQQCAAMQADLLREMAPFFSRLDPSAWPTIQRGVSACGVCGRAMDLRRQPATAAALQRGAQETRALVCPRCRDHFPTPRGALAAVQVNCPICNFQAVEVTTEQGRRHKVCPHCFSRPPAAQARDGASFSNGFRCFECTDPRCQLATGQASGGEKIRPCILPACGHQMLLKKNRNSFYLGCESYPECKATIWLPGAREGTAVTPAAASCAVCRTNPPIRHLEFRWKRMTVPPHVPLHYTGCVGGCDRLLRDLLDAGNRNSDRLWAPQGPPLVAIHDRPHPAPLSAPDTAPRNHLAPIGTSARVNPPHASPSASSTSTTPSRSQEVPVGRALEKFLTAGPRPNLGPVMTHTAPSRPATAGGGGARGGGGAAGAGWAGAGGGAGGGGAGGGGGGAGGGVRCGEHKEECVLLTCRRGANEGRQFFKCARPEHERCQFFQWADEPPRPPPAAGGGAGPGAGGACYKCGEPGHFSRDCPNQQSAGGSGRGGRANEAGGGGGFAGAGGAGAGGCFECGQPGHFARDCPNRGAARPQGAGPGRARY